MLFHQLLSIVQIAHNHAIIHFGSYQFTAQVHGVFDTSPQTLITLITPRRWHRAPATRLYRILARRFRLPADALK